MFEINKYQKASIANFFAKKDSDSVTVFFDEDRISFSTTVNLYNIIIDEELTIYANGKTKIEKSESISASENTTKPVKKDDFY